MPKFGFPQILADKDRRFADSQNLYPNQDGMG